MEFLSMPKTKEVAVAPEEPPSGRAVNADQPTDGKRSVAPKEIANPAAVPGGKALTPPQRFIIKPGPQSLRFLTRYFPGTGIEQWSDWHWQLRNSFTSMTKLARVVRLSEEEVNAFRMFSRKLPMRITPYYASLLDPDDPRQPLRRTVIPVAQEFITSPGEGEDPLGEDAQRPVARLVHRYPDRVLFLSTGFCFTNCRYCTRSRLVSNRSNYSFAPSQLKRAVDYIRGHREVRDVLISGGDPLTLTNEQLGFLLEELRQIKHVEIIRLGTKAPVVLPQRITGALLKILKRHKRLWMNIHFTHPDELTPETITACSRLAEAGIPLGSQTVLLRGINDDVDTLRRLFQGLLRIRVRPYYLYQCDPISGSSHFRTPVQTGLDMISGLRGFTTGLAVPHYVIDAPRGGGKIPLLPGYLIDRDASGIKLKNYENKMFFYPELCPLPEPETVAGTSVTGEVTGMPCISD